MFWSLNLEQDGLKSYETMDLKMKSAVLSKKYCNVFEYVLEKDIPGKINEKEGIFFDIIQKNRKIIVNKTNYEQRKYDNLDFLYANKSTKEDSLG